MSPPILAIIESNNYIYRTDSYDPIIVSVSKELTIADFNKPNKQAVLLSEGEPNLWRVPILDDWTVDMKRLPLYPVDLPEPRIFHPYSNIEVGTKPNLYRKEVEELILKAAHLLTIYKVVYLWNIDQSYKIEYVNNVVAKYSTFTNQPLS